MASTSSRGGDGRTPAATDPRQGTARAEASSFRGGSGLLGVLLGCLVVVIVAGVGLLLSQPGLSVWGWGILAAATVAGLFLWWRRRSSASSIESTLSNLGE